MTHIELIEFLKSTELFSSLNHQELDELLKKFETMHIRKNKLLFRQGSLSDSFYLLVEGKLLVNIKIDKNGQKFTHELMPGETVGELGALSHEPRTATVKVLEDSFLLKIPSKTFIEISHRYPALSIALINTTFARSREFIKLISSGEVTKKRIVIIAANKKTLFDEFIHAFKNQAKHFSDMVLLFEDDIKVTTSAFEKENKTILYFIKNADSELAKIGFKKVDMIYVVANHHEHPTLDSFILKKINDNKYNIKPELILLHENDQPPKNTAKWLKLARFNLHHHIRMANEKDYQRVIRFVRGQAIGIVLGGGGLRSWAHLGALQALIKSNIPIDAIGGTSAGAIVAGFYVLHESCNDPRHNLEKFSEIARNTIALKNLTWPAASLFNGVAYTKKLKQMFASFRIENLWIPYFCISCDLSNNKQVIHRSGYLWKAIRSSSAVPAVFPAVVVHGKLYLDGGILNNLPVDVMKKTVGTEATIVAVELTRNNIDPHDYHFPPTLPFWKTALAKMGLAYKEYKFPTFVDTFLKALLAGSSAKQNENSLMADVLIAPDLSKFSLLNVKKEQYAVLTSLGYDAAMQAIKKWKKKTN